MYEIDTSLIEWLQAPKGIDIDESLANKIARVLDETNLNLLEMRGCVVHPKHTRLLCSASLWQEVVARVGAHLPTSDMMVRCVVVIGGKFDAIAKDETIYINLTSAESSRNVLVGLLSHEMVHCIANKLFGFKPKKPSISEFLRRMYIEGCCMQLQYPFGVHLEERDELKMRTYLQDVDATRAQLARDVSSAMHNGREFDVAFLWSSWMKNFGPGYGLAYATVAEQTINSSLFQLLCGLRDSPQEFYSELLGSRRISEELIQREPARICGGNL